MKNKDILEKFKNKYLISEEILLNTIANIINNATSKELDGIYSTWSIIIKENL